MLPAGGSAGVTVTVATSLPAALVPGAEKVEGVLAQVTCRSHNECSVLWRRPAGEYVTVLLERTGGRDQPALFQAEALKVARGLQATPLRQPPTVVLGLLPPSCRIARADPETMALIASGPNPLHLCDVSVSLGKSVEPDGYRFKDATLGGRKARIAEGQSGAMRFWLVGIALPDGRTLGVQVPQGNGWNRAELDRFVRAIVLP